MQERKLQIRLILIKKINFMKSFCYKTFYVTLPKRLKYFYYKSEINTSEINTSERDGYNVQFIHSGFILAWAEQFLTFPIKKIYHGICPL